MSEEIQLLKEVAIRLENAGIAYMMTGSMALALYVTPRMTRDIDIVLQVAPSDSQRIVSLFEKDFYVEEASVRQALHAKGMFNIIHNESVIKIDFIVRKDEAYRIEEFHRKQKIEIDGVGIWVVSAEDLILSKLVWIQRSESELQLRDVRQMMVALKDIDQSYLTRWAERLGVKNLLEKVSGYE